MIIHITIKGQQIKLTRKESLCRYSGNKQNNPYNDKMLHQYPVKEIIKEYSEKTKEIKYKNQIIITDFTERTKFFAESRKKKPKKRSVRVVHEPGCLAEQ